VRRRFIIRSPPSRPCFPDSPRHVSWKLWLGGQSSFDAQDPRESIGAVPSTVEGPKVLGKTTKTSDRPRRQSPSLVRGHAVVRPLRTIVSAGHGAESLGNKPKKMSPLSKRMPIYNRMALTGLQLFSTPEDIQERPALPPMEDVPPSSTSKEGLSCLILTPPDRWLNSAVCCDPSSSIQGSSSVISFRPSISSRSSPRRWARPATASSPPS
jgi:hypothetical protein